MSAPTWVKPWMGLLVATSSWRQWIVYLKTRIHCVWTSVGCVGTRENNGSSGFPPTTLKVTLLQCLGCCHSHFNALSTAKQKHKENQKSQTDGHLNHTTSKKVPLITSYRQLLKVKLIRRITPSQMNPDPFHIFQQQCRGDNSENIFLVPNRSVLW